MKKISSIDALEALYGEPMERALWKELDHISEHYRQFIEQSPFLILATHGDKGLDCSPRGDPPGFVRVVDEHCVQLPDRRGNNRVDSLRNIVANPGVGLIFLVPGVGEALRLSGRAEILVDATLCDSFSISGKPATSVLSISVDKVYYQCQKAIARSQLWNADSHIERSALPTAGQMAKVFAGARGLDFDAEAYDRDYPEHLKKSIY